MKMNFLRSWITGGALLAFIACNTSDESPVFKKVAKKDRIDLAIKQERKKTQNPITLEVERYKLKAAYEYMEAYKAQLASSRAAISGVTWTERGPNNIGGRTRALLYDANDVTGNTVFAAGVGGGLWKTTDINASSPNWTAVNDFFDNIAITCIAQDPTNAQIMYFGTGEGFFNGDAIMGDGVWKSTDGGNSFTQLASTDGNFNFEYVQKVHVTNNGTLLVAARSQFASGGGLFRSTNGGTSFTQVSTGNSGTSGRQWANDIKEAANGDLYATFGLFYNDGIYKSTNDGVSWSRVFTANTNENRIDIACAPSNSSVIYGLIQENDNTISRIIKSTNAGGTWTATNLPSWSDQCAGGVSDFTRGQAFYDLALAVSPSSANTVIIGGIDLLKTTDGGSSWTQISEWANCSGLADVHADQHIVIYKPGSSTEILVGNDGGVYQSTDANNSFPSFSFKSDNYNVTQYYACAIHPTSGSNHFLAGAQDNGSHRFSSLGINSVSEVSGGDGAFCHIDQNDPNYQFTSYVYNNLYRSTNGGASFNFVVSRNTGQFINASDYDSDAGIMYMGGNAGILERWDNPKTGNSISTFSFMGSDYASAICADPNTANRVWVGTDNGAIYRVDNANGTPSVTTISAANINAVGGYISCVEVENGDANHLLVTFSSYGVNSVWESTDGGASFTSVEGNLPDMPIRWAIFSPVNSGMAMLATELGVWSTNNLNGGSTDWQPSVSGLANVRTDMLQVRESDNIVIAATHGRGLFSSAVFATASCDFVADKTLSYGGKDIQFTDASIGASSWLWDFGDGNTSTEQNPVHQYLTAGRFTVTLTINGNLSETKTDYIHILPNRGTPYVNADGGNFESNFDDFGAESELGGDLWELGTPSNFLNNTQSGVNVWKTDLDADVTETDYQAYLYTPNYNLSAAGTYTLQLGLAMELTYCNLPYSVQIQYSTDKGDTWSTLGSYNDANGTNWYNADPSTSCAVHSLVFADQQGWMFSQNTFVTAQYDLSSFSGVPDMAFRIAFHNISGVTSAGYNDGVAVDNFQILGTSNTESPLPITLASFTGQAKADGNLIEWVTSSEKNTDYFELRRSEDGQNFEAITQINAQGNSNTRVLYDYLDEAFFGTTFYQLIEVDQDGTKFDLGTIIINRTEDFRIFPNPSKGVFYLENANVSFNDVIEVYNMTGQQVYKSKFERSLNLEHLDKGFYFIKVGQNIEKVLIE